MATQQSKQIAFSVLCRHPHVLLDDEPLDELIEDIALAIDQARLDKPAAKQTACGD